MRTNTGHTGLMYSADRTQRRIGNTIPEAEGERPMSDLYKCERCGNVYPAENIIYKRLPDEDLYLCPHCKSSELIQGRECEYCGEFYPEYEEYFDNCCYKCGHDAEKALKEYLKEGKEMSKKQKKIMWDFWGCL